MIPVCISHHTATTCVGTGTAALLQALENGASGLAPCHFDTVDFPTWTGMVQGLEQLAFPSALAAYDCRNNRLALLGLMADGFHEKVRALAQRHGAHRVAVMLGTSTSGIYSTELAYRQRDPVTGALPASFHYDETHNTFSVAAFVRQWLGLQGPAAVVSTACSSSAKVFASAARMLQLGMADAVLVGGVDTLCLTTLYGFRSLGLTSARACRPYDAARDGLSIGEGAAFAVLERAGQSLPAGSLLLSGYGETSDAHHMSAPHPEGEGARAAMQAALQMAGLQPGHIGYINLHGTATPSNDLAEGKAVTAVFGDTVPCSSTKGHTGHTLGAAGAVEAAVCLQALQHGLLPGGVHTRQPDEAIGPLSYLLQTRHAPGLQHVLSNSFGFGGSNCSLIFSKAGGLPQ